MTSLSQSRGVPMTKARVYYAMENTVLLSSDTDFLLPPLESGTVKRVNSSNVLEQNRYEKYRNQLQKEKDEAKLRFYCRKQDFLRSSIVISERNVQSSKRKFRLVSESVKKQESFKPANLNGNRKVKEDFFQGQNTENAREHSSLINNPTIFVKPPYFLPPLYKSIFLDAKDVKNRKEKQDDEKLHIMTIDDVKKCRYLRIAGRAKLIFEQTETV